MNPSSRMRNDHSIMHVARVVLEAVTPLSIGTGSPDGVFDSALVRDANGLPALPATSVAGVLRSLWTHLYGPDSARRMFGFQSKSAGSSSLVQLGWGCLLGSDGRAAAGLLLGKEAERLHNDPLFSDVLSQSRMPVHRNRVRLTHRGAAADAGKFDRSVLPAGHRFAIEIRLQAEAESADASFRDLLALFSHPGFRLGGGSRAGLGGMRCVTMRTACFDLRNPAEARALGALGADPSLTTGMKPAQPGPVDCRGWIEASLELRAHGLWRIGQGDLSIHPAGDADKAPDLLPVTERRVEWVNGVGRLRDHREVLIPGSSIKGVLAHRMTFHARRFAGHWAPAAGAAHDMDPPPEVLSLFGAVKDKVHDGAEAGGWAGCLLIEDTYLKPSQPVRLMHNSIDRFTGGVREHMLFEEECLVNGQICVRVAVDLGRLARGANWHGVSIEQIQRSFVAAVRDLCEGRLALGAKSTTGLGVFRGEPPAALREPWPQTA